MRWFKHKTDAHDNKKLKPLIRLHGVEGYGRYWLLLEEIAKNIRGSSGHVMIMSRQDWANILHTKSQQVDKLLQCLQHLQLISFSVAGDDITITCDKLLEHKDEYTRKSGYGPKQLRTISGQCQASEKETEKETDTEKEIDKKNPPLPPSKIDGVPYDEIVSDLNRVTGKKYKPNSEATRALIRGRWGEGFRLDDFKRVHRNKAARWKGDPKMDDFLRPDTLYAKGHFESYLNESADGSMGSILDNM